ncbi:MAG: type I DNA topoisomerase [Candidatus Paceibacterota bacterium]
MKLLIVESPSKAKTISKYIGKDFIVRASVGHVRDLPKSQKKALDIEGGFIPHYEIVAKKQNIIDDIQSSARNADEILLATDPDREGEAIAWHLKEILTKKALGGDIPASKIKRITYHEVTKEAVEEALKHPRPIDENLREAQEARRVLDRIVGYDLSGLIWKKVRYGLSAGRVQSPALRIIMEREREIRAFKPETFWVISGKWNTPKKDELTLTCSEEPRDKKEVDRILGIAKKEKWQVIDVEESEQKRSPRAPFITSTLQQAASSRLGFSPSRTMGIAQKLYEAGYITYMRTDSTNLGQQALEQISKAIEKQYGKDHLLLRTYSAKSKNAQEAHEAIRPTHAEKMNAGANDEQKKLYRLIWQRTVASQMADARIAKTKVIANVTSSPASLPNFEVIGTRILFEGWMKADPESENETVILPVCNKGEPLDLINIDSLEKQTQPPPRYTEAGLIKELEKRGIGRPSTYATISKTIEDRGYVMKEARSLRPTDTGEVVSTFLEDNFPTYISDTFTATMEDKLDGIANGTHKYFDTLQEFYVPFHKDVESKENIEKITNLGEADNKFRCPKCQGKMVIKLGKNGKFISCARYPDCDGALTIEGFEIKKDEPIGIDPTTNLPIFVLSGRFGPYVQLGVKPPKVAKKRKTKKEKLADLASDKDKATSAEKPASDSSEVLAESPVPKVIKPRMASIPKGMDPSKVTMAEALKYLSLPRNLGKNPKTEKDIIASMGRFGPYVMEDGNFRSVKFPDDVYTISLDRALELLAQEKKPRGFQKKKKEPVGGSL